MLNRKKCFVNIYIITLGYGGPEEGGWWYTDGSPEKSVQVTNKKNLDATIQALRKEYFLDESNNYTLQGQYEDPMFDRNRNSGRSGVHGYDVVLRVEKHQAKHWPEGRPHYE